MIKYSAFAIKIFYLDIYLNIVFEGHSMMHGNGRTNIEDSIPNVTAAILNGNGIYHELCTPSDTIALMSARWATANAYKAAAPYKNILPFWMGITDLDSIGNQATVWADLLVYINQALTAGWTPIMYTTTHVDMNVWSRSNIVIDGFNTLMKANKPAESYVIDLSVHSEFDDPTDTDYFVDGLHMTSASYAICAADLITLITTLYL